MDTLEIQQLKYFIAIVEHKGFTRAADKLYITQPMLSRCIKDLEAELNVKLIDRTNKSFILTDAGEVLYQKGMQLLQLYQDLFRILSDVKSADIGEIRISSPGVLLDMYFPEILIDFRKQNPGIRISIVEEGSAQVAKSVLNGDADMGLVMMPVNHLCEMEVISVINDEVCLMVNKSHAFASQQAVNLRQLEDVELATYGESATLYSTLMRMCEDCGFYPTIVYKSLMPMFVREMVANGSCVGVLPQPVILKHLGDDLTCVRLEPKLHWNISMITNKNRYKSFATAKLVEFIQNHFNT